MSRISSLPPLSHSNYHANTSSSSARNKAAAHNNHQNNNNNNNNNSNNNNTSSSEHASFASKSHPLPIAPSSPGQYMASLSHQLQHSPLSSYPPLSSSNNSSNHKAHLSSSSSTSSLRGKNPSFPLLPSPPASQVRVRDSRPHRLRPSACQSGPQQFASQMHHYIFVYLTRAKNHKLFTHLASPSSSPHKTSRHRDPPSVSSGTMCSGSASSPRSRRKHDIVPAAEPHSLQTQLNITFQQLQELCDITAVKYQHTTNISLSSSSSSNVDLSSNCILFFQLIQYAQQHHHLFQHMDDMLAYMRDKMQLLREVHTLLNNNAHALFEQPDNMTLESIMTHINQIRASVTQAQIQAAASQSQSQSQSPLQSSPSSSSQSLYHISSGPQSSSSSSLFSPTSSSDVVLPLSLEEMKSYVALFINRTYRYKNMDEMKHIIMSTYQFDVLQKVEKGEMILSHDINTVPKISMINARRRSVIKSKTIAGNNNKVDKEKEKDKEKDKEKEKEKIREKLRDRDEEKTSDMIDDASSTQSIKPDMISPKYTVKSDITQLQPITQSSQASPTTTNKALASPSATLSARNNLKPITSNNNTNNTNNKSSNVEMVSTHTFSMAKDLAHIPFYQAQFHANTASSSASTDSSSLASSKHVTFSAKFFSPLTSATKTTTNSQISSSSSRTSLTLSTSSSSVTSYPVDSFEYKLRHDIYDYLSRPINAQHIFLHPINIPSSTTLSTLSFPLDTWSLNLDVLRAQINELPLYNDTMSQIQQFVANRTHANPSNAASSSNFDQINIIPYFEDFPSFIYYLNSHQTMHQFHHQLLSYLTRESCNLFSPTSITLNSDAIHVLISELSNIRLPQQSSELLHVIFTFEKFGIIFQYISSFTQAVLLSLHHYLSPLDDDAVHKHKHDRHSKLSLPNSSNTSGAPSRNRSRNNTRTSLPSSSELLLSANSSRSLSPSSNAQHVTATGNHDEQGAASSSTASSLYTVPIQHSILPIPPPPSESKLKKQYKQLRSLLLTPHLLKTELNPADITIDKLKLIVNEVSTFSRCSEVVRHVKLFVQTRQQFVSLQEIKDKIIQRERIIRDYERKVHDILSQQECLLWNFSYSQNTTTSFEPASLNIQYDIHPLFHVAALYLHVHNYQLPLQFIQTCIFIQQSYDTYTGFYAAFQKYVNQQLKKQMEEYVPIIKNFMSHPLNHLLEFSISLSDADIYYLLSIGPSPLELYYILHCLQYDFNLQFIEIIQEFKLTSATPLFAYHSLSDLVADILRLYTSKNINDDLRNMSTRSYAQNIMANTIYAIYYLLNSKDCAFIDCIQFPSSTITVMNAANDDDSTQEKISLNHVVELIEFMRVELHSPSYHHIAITLYVILLHMFYNQKSYLQRSMPSLNGAQGSLGATPIFNNYSSLQQYLLQEYSEFYITHKQMIQCFLFLFLVSKNNSLFPPTMIMHDIQARSRESEHISSNNLQPRLTFSTLQSSHPFQPSFISSRLSHTHPASIIPLLLNMYDVDKLFTVMNDSSSLSIFHVLKFKKLREQLRVEQELKLKAEVSATSPRLSIVKVSGITQLIQSAKQQAVANQSQIGSTHPILMLNPQTPTFLTIDDLQTNLHQEYKYYQLRANFCIHHLQDSECVLFQAGYMYASKTKKRPAGYNPQANTTFDPSYQSDDEYELFHYDPPSNEQLLYLYDHSFADPLTLNYIKEIEKDVLQQRESSGGMEKKAYNVSELIDILKVLQERECMKEKISYIQLYLDILPRPSTPEYPLSADTSSSSAQSDNHETHTAVDEQKHDVESHDDTRMIAPIDAESKFILRARVSPPQCRVWQSSSSAPPLTLSDDDIVALLQTCSHMSELLLYIELEEIFHTAMYDNFSQFLSAIQQARDESHKQAQQILSYLTDSRTHLLPSSITSRLTLQQVHSLFENSHAGKFTIIHLRQLHAQLILQHYSNSHRKSNSSATQIPILSFSSLEDLTLSTQSSHNEHVDEYRADVDQVHASLEPHIHEYKLTVKNSPVNTDQINEWNLEQIRTVLHCLDPPHRATFVFHPHHPTAFSASESSSSPSSPSSSSSSSPSSSSSALYVDNPLHGVRDVARCMRIIDTRQQVFSKPQQLIQQIKIIHQQYQEDYARTTNLFFVDKVPLIPTAYQLNYTLLSSQQIHDLLGIQYFSSSFCPLFSVYDTLLEFRDLSRSFASYQDLFNSVVEARTIASLAQRDLEQQIVDFSTKSNCCLFQPRLLEQPDIREVRKFIHITHQHQTDAMLLLSQLEDQINNSKSSSSLRPFTSFNALIDHCSQLCIMRHKRHSELLHFIRNVHNPLTLPRTLLPKLQEADMEPLRELEEAFDLDIIQWLSQQQQINMKNEQNTYVHFNTLAELILHIQNLPHVSAKSIKSESPAPQQASAEDSNIPIDQSSSNNAIQSLSVDTSSQPAAPKSLSRVSSLILPLSSPIATLPSPEPVIQDPEVVLSNDRYIHELKLVQRVYEQQALLTKISSTKQLLPDRIEEESEPRVDASNDADATANTYIDPAYPPMENWKHADNQDNQTAQSHSSEDSWLNDTSDHAAATSINTPETIVEIKPFVSESSQVSVQVEPSPAANQDDDAVASLRELQCLTRVSQCFTDRCLIEFRGNEELQYRDDHYMQIVRHDEYVRHLKAQAELSASDPSAASLPDFNTSIDDLGLVRVSLSSPLSSAARRFEVMNPTSNEYMCVNVQSQSEQFIVVNQHSTVYLAPQTAFNVDLQENSPSHVDASSSPSSACVLISIRNMLPFEIEDMVKVSAEMFWIETQTSKITQTKTIVMNELQSYFPPASPYSLHSHSASRVITTPPTPHAASSPPSPPHATASPSPSPNANVASSSPSPALEQPPAQQPTVAVITAGEQRLNSYIQSLVSASFDDVLEAHDFFHRSYALKRMLELNEHECFLRLRQASPTCGSVEWSNTVDDLHTVTLPNYALLMSSTGHVQLFVHNTCEHPILLSIDDAQTQTWCKFTNVPVLAANQHANFILAIHPAAMQALTFPQNIIISVVALSAQELNDTPVNKMKKLFKHRVKQCIHVEINKNPTEHTVKTSPAKPTDSNNNNTASASAL